MVLCSGSQQIRRARKVDLLLVSDSTQRERDRAAATGGFEERVMALRQRQRSGRPPFRKIPCTLNHARRSPVNCLLCGDTGLQLDGAISLAAFAGDEIAQSLIDMYEYSDHITGICPCGDCRLGEGLDVWLHFVRQRYGREVAAVAIRDVAGCEDFDDHSRWFAALARAREVHWREWSRVRERLARWALEEAGDECADL